MWKKQKMQYRKKGSEYQDQIDSNYNYPGNNDESE